MQQCEIRKWYVDINCSFSCVMVFTDENIQSDQMQAKLVQAGLKMPTIFKTFLFLTIFWQPQAPKVFAEGSFVNPLGKDQIQQRREEVSFRFSDELILT